MVAQEILMPRALVVEDEPITLADMTGILKRAGAFSPFRYSQQGFHASPKFEEGLLMFRSILSVVLLTTGSLSYATSVYDIKDAYGVIITSPTSGETFELQSLTVSDCEVREEASLGTRAHICKSATGQLSIQNSVTKEITSSTISRALIYEGQTQAGKPYVIYRFVTDWSGSISGFNWESRAVITLTDYDAPESELNGSFFLSRFEHSFPISARWRE